MTIGRYQLDAVLRSGLRFDVPWLVEPQEVGITAAPVQAQLNNKVYDVPRFEASADQVVQFNMPIHKLLAQYDGGTDIVCSLRVDLHYAVNNSDAASGNIVMNLYGYASAHNSQLAAGTPTAFTPAATHTFAEDSANMTTDSDYKSTRDIANASYGLIIDRADLSRDSFWTFRLEREGTSGSDTYGGDFFLLGVELVFFYGDKP